MFKMGKLGPKVLKWLAQNYLTRYQRPEDQNLNYWADVPHGMEH